MLGPIVAGDVERPLLGVCYGHQWLAHELGGTVTPARADGSKIVGIGETRFEGGRLLPGNPVLRVVVSHREVVSAVPDELRTTATVSTRASAPTRRGCCARFSTAPDRTPDKRRAGG